ncbi:MAG: VOC family protein [Acidimicrobiia bacterium]
MGFEGGSTRLTIGVHEQVRGKARDALRILINLAVDDIDQLHDRLVGAGALCLREPSPEPWGGFVATYSDPDGNTVQTMTGTARQ